jgi:hypothetical protein
MKSNASDSEVLRSYLLGTLAEEPRARVEERLFSDDSVFLERLCLVEDELIDDYVAGDLNADEAGRFEGSFLCTDERRGKLEFARALTAYVQKQPAPNPRTGHWLRRPVSMPAWSVAAGLALLLLPGIVAWQVGSGRSGSSDVSVLLTPGLTRDVGANLTRVRVSPDCKLIRLQIDPGTSKYVAYGVSLHNTAGEEILKQRKLNTDTTAGHAAVSMVVPCELLPPEDYYIRLEGIPQGKEAAIVPLDKYPFRVLRE